MRALRTLFLSTLALVLVLGLPQPAVAKTPVSKRPAHARVTPAAKRGPAKARPAAAARSSSARSPDVRSASVLVMDRNTGSILYSRKADQVAPIASITKLMTALVVLDGQQSLDEVVTISNEEVGRTQGNPSRLAVGTELTRRQLLHLALMSSENRAAQALARSYPGGETAFVRTMNAKARALEMTHSRFVDPTGLSPDNVSNPQDLAKLVVAAHRDALIREYSTSRSETVTVRRQPVEFRNTNPLVRDPHWDISVQKTGHIQAAGQCLVLQAQIDGRPVVMVLLNSSGKYTRVADARRIRDWMGVHRVGDLAATGGASPPSS